MDKDIGLISLSQKDDAFELQMLRKTLIFLTAEDLDQSILKIVSSFRKGNDV